MRHPKILPLAALASVSLLLAACGGSPGSTPAASGPQPPPVIPADGPGPSGTNALTVLVVAVDSLMPEDIDATAMPNISGLVQNGTLFTESRSVFSAETIPNHVAMMTGVYPDRNGIPTNNFWDKDANPATPDDEDLDNPNELTAKTLFTWIDEQCRQGGAPANPNFRTSAVLSKTYLYEIFRGDANDPQTNDIGLTNVEPDENWEPSTSPGYIGPGSEHTPDNFTGPEARNRLDNADFMFINMGDVDRASHAGGPAARVGVRRSADQQVGDLIGDLQNAGRWDNTVFIVVSDHGMDFSDPSSNAPSGNARFDTTGLNSLLNSLSTQPLLNVMSTACGYEPMLAVQNGGTNSIVVTNLSATAANKQRTMAAARACLLNFDGSAGNDPDGGTPPPACADTVGPVCKVALDAVQPTNLGAIELAWYSNPDLYNGANLAGLLAADTGGIMPASIRSRHENLGDLVLVIGDGFKFSEPDSSGNPIPGNHGHMPTIHNTMIISGGASFLNRGVVVNTGTDSHFERHANQSENIDVAATVAWVLGLGIQDSDFPDVAVNYPDYGDGQTLRAGFDGRVLIEAFNIPEGSPPSNCGLAPSP